MFSPGWSYQGNTAEPWYLQQPWSAIITETSPGKNSQVRIQIVFDYLRLSGLLMKITSGRLIIKGKKRPNYWKNWHSSSPPENQPENIEKQFLQEIKTNQTWRTGEGHLPEIICYLMGFRKGVGGGIMWKPPQHETNEIVISHSHLFKVSQYP